MKTNLPRLPSLKSLRLPSLVPLKLQKRSSPGNLHEAAILFFGGIRPKLFYHFYMMNLKLTTLPLVCALACSLTLNSCQTTNPYTGEQQTSRSTSGAVIGGLIGAGLGSLTGSGSTDRRQKAMVGAGIGALAGGLIGDYMDKQEAELRHHLEGTGVSVTRNGDNLILNMPGDITFATDSSSVNDRARNTLDGVGMILAKYKRTMVDITGHTDNVGNSTYNYQLSEKRARSVAGYLKDGGVMNQRILIHGRGPDQPTASNNTAAGRQANRRVTIELVPSQS